MRRLLKTMVVVMAIGSAKDGISKEIFLKQPNLKDPFLQILSNRKSTKSFDKTKEISEDTLGEILWSAYGINRSDGRRTIPTAMNRQDLDVYVIRENGAWLYDAKKEKLTLVSDKNILSLFAEQDYMDDVSVVLLYVAKEVNKDNYALLHAGSSYQNVSLYCVKNGLSDVVRAYFNRNGVAKELKIKENNIIISQAIGYPL
jgi:nitroreductase